MKCGFWYFENDGKYAECIGFFWKETEYWFWSEFFGKGLITDYPEKCKFRL